MSLLILYHCQNKVTTLYPFFIFLETAMRVSIPGHVFLNFSGTAQNWMAIVVPPHCPLPRGSSFLELDYWEETDHSEDLSNFIGASPKLDAKWMMHHHDDLSMLMVAPHGCVGWWSWSIFNEKQVVFHQCSLLVTHKDDILHQFTLVALETQSSFTLVQFYHTIGYEPNVSSKKDRRWY